MITSASKGKSNANSHVCYKVLFEHIKTTGNKFTSPKISIQYVTCFSASYQYLYIKIHICLRLFI